MNSGATSERVYDALKGRILSGEFRPAARLDPSSLADTLAASVTPVRDALHRLTGEGLVVTRTSDGFHMPGVHEPGLRDLYGWSAQLIAIGLGARQSVATPPALPAATIPLVDRAAQLFIAIVRRSANAEHQRAIGSVNDRLHTARLVEPEILGDGEAELQALHAAWLAAELGHLRRLVRSYHQRRSRSVAEIVRRLYQG